MTVTQYQSYRFHLRPAPLALTAQQHQQLIEHNISIEQINQISVDVIASLPSRYVSSNNVSSNNVNNSVSSNVSHHMSDSASTHIHHPASAFYSPILQDSTHQLDSLQNDSGSLYLSYFIGIKGESQEETIRDEAFNNEGQAQKAILNNVSYTSNYIENHIYGSDSTSKEAYKNTENQVGLNRPNLPLTLSQLQEALDWQPWQASKVLFTDYLWEQSCLECFIAGREPEYIEINANPAGQYAVYHFDNYRSPAELPPRALQVSNVTSSQQAWIHWHANNPDSLDMPPMANSINHIARHFSFDLMQLPTAIRGIHQLHPCVILNLAGVSFYFAPQHANPPDFHDRQYWSIL